MYRILLTAFIGIASILSNVAQNNANQNLTDRQKLLQDSTLSYSQKILHELNDKLLLPKEVNTLLGIDDQVKIYVKAQWNEAYFEQNNNYASSLILPLKAEYNGSEILATLNVVRDVLQYHRIVTSQFTLTTDTVTEYLSINSNIYGEFVGAQIYDNKMELKESVPISKKMISDAIWKSPSPQTYFYMNNENLYRIFHSSQSNRVSINNQLKKTSKETYLKRTDSKGRQNVRFR